MITSENNFNLAVGKGTQQLYDMQENQNLWQIYKYLNLLKFVFILFAMFAYCFFASA